MSSPALEHGSRAWYRQEFERLRREFEGTGAGQASLRDRTQFVDKLALRLWEQYVPTTVSSGFALAALGGFGRGALFPHSDIDLLFLAENDALRGSMKDPVRSMCQEMWDTGLRVSPTTRTLDECARFDPDRPPAGYLSLRQWQPLGAGHGAAANRGGMSGDGPAQQVGEIGVNWMERQERHDRRVEVLDVCGLTLFTASSVGLLFLCVALG